VLHKALQDAVATGALGANPASRPQVKLPKRERHQMHVLDEMQILKFLDAVHADAAKKGGTRLAALYEVAIYSGARQAELLGARWKDVNLDLGVLSIQQIYYRSFGFKATKTNHSRRVIELDAHLVSVLRQHRRAQDVERRAFGPDYQDHDLLFCQPDGRPLDGQSLTRNEFRRLLKAAGCPAIRFHDLRHSCASWRLQTGEGLKVVSDLLGHSSVAITGDVYAHAVVGMQRQGTARLTERLAALRAAAKADTESEGVTAPAQAGIVPETVENRPVEGRIH
jgi:integrase